MLKRQLDFSEHKPSKIVSITIQNCRCLFVVILLYQILYTPHTGPVLVRNHSRREIRTEEISCLFSHSCNLLPFLLLALWVLEPCLNRDITSAGKYFFPICLSAWWIVSSTGIHFSDWGASALIMSLLCKKSGHLYF